MVPVAIAVAGLWGIWRGLVQRRTIETLGGLAVTVLLMVGGAGRDRRPRPARSATHRSSRTRDRSDILSAASTGRVKRPGRVSSRTRCTALFDSLVLEPWCALEFGDVEWCLAHPRNTSSLTNADVWLAFPAQSGQRESLYKLTKGESARQRAGSSAARSPSAICSAAPATSPPAARSARCSASRSSGRQALQGRDAKLSARVQDLVQKDPERVRIQEGGGTFPRIALLALIALGMLGASALLAYVGVRLLLAAILSLILLLLAPAMLLAPAFGESGRATFIAWAKRLVGALAAKLDLRAPARAALDRRGGARVASDRLVWHLAAGDRLLVGRLAEAKGAQSGFASVGRGGLRHGQTSTRRLYRDARQAGFALGTARRRAAGLAGAPVLALARVGHGRATTARRPSSRAPATSSRAGAERALGIQLQGARATLARNAALDSELRDTNRGLSKYDTQVQIAKQRGEELADRECGRAGAAGAPRGARGKQGPTGGRSRRPTASPARPTATCPSRETSSQTKTAPPSSSSAAATSSSGLAADHERSLRFAGLDPRTYDRASAGERARMAKTSQEAIERDRRLLGALPERGRPAPGDAELKHATIELPPERVRERTREQRQVRAQERLQRAVASASTGHEQARAGGPRRYARDRLRGGGRVRLGE